MSHSNYETEYFYPVKLYRLATIPALLLSGQFLAGCSPDPVQAAYDDCMAQVESVNAEVDHDAMQQLAAGIQQMAESACGMILTSCEKDRDGPLCQGMISEYQQQ